MPSQPSYPSLGYVLYGQRKQFTESVRTQNRTTGVSGDKAERCSTGDTHIQTATQSSPVDVPSISLAQVSGIVYTIGVHLQLSM